MDESNIHVRCLRALAATIVTNSESRVPAGLQGAADELERLQGIVDKLPKTADGVPVVPGARVWQTPADWYGVHISMNAGSYCGTLPEWNEVYSTREAAKAAGGK